MQTLLRMSSVQTLLRMSFPKPETLLNPKQSRRDAEAGGQGGSCPGSLARGMPRRPYTAGRTRVRVGTRVCACVCACMCWKHKCPDFSPPSLPPSPSLSFLSPLHPPSSSTSVLFSHSLSPYISHFPARSHSLLSFSPPPRSHPCSGVVQHLAAQLARTRMHLKERGDEGRGEGGEGG